MKQYWQKKDQNIQGKCPIHNYPIPKYQNQKNNAINNLASPSYTQQQSQINSTRRKSTQAKKDTLNIGYNNINSNQNNNISNNYNNYDANKYNYKSNQINNNNSKYIEVNYNNQTKNMNKDSNSNITNDDYTNNYSFYISGTSRPKVILNFPEKDDNDNQNISQSKYIYQTLNIPRGSNSQNQKYINSYNNRSMINQNNSSPIFIRTEDKQPVIYNAPQKRQPLMQRRVVNEEYNETNRVYYTTEPRDNNYIRNNQQQPRPTIRQINNYNSNENNSRYYYDNMNQNQFGQKIYPKIDYYDSYQHERFNAPYIHRSNTNTNQQDYSRQRGRIINTNYSQNERADLSYNDQNPNNIFFDQNNYFINRTETNSPRYRAPPYFDYSPDLYSEGNNIYNRNWERQSEYYSNKDLRNQRGFKYKYENEINDNIYKVPEPYNQENREIDYYEDNKGSFLSERPFAQTNTYIQRDEKGRKYRVFTQDLPTNRNYNSINNSYEYMEEYNNMNNRRTNRNPPRAYRNSMNQTDYRDQELRYNIKDRNNNIRNHPVHKSRSKKKHKKYYNKGAIPKDKNINTSATLPRYERGSNNYNDHEKTISMQNINNYNGNDEREQIYAPISQMARDNEYNFRRLSEDYKMKIRQKNENDNEYERNEFPQEEEIEENDELYRGNEIYKKIETEISEKFYDNEGNYLGEKKTITMKKVPIEGYPQQNEEEIYEEQEEQKEYENKNLNKYKSTHKKSEKNNRTVPKNQNSSLNKNNYKGSKYLSYFHKTNTDNKVYREIIGSPENNEDLTEKEKNKNKNHKKFIIYGIESNNLDALFENIQNAQKEDNEDIITYSDEKEGDEQHIEIKSQIEEEEEEKGIINENEIENNEIKENANESNNENKMDNINEKLNNDNFVLEKEEQNQNNNAIQENILIIFKENKINNDEDKNDDNNNQNEEKIINNNLNINEDNDNIGEQNDFNKDNEHNDEDNNNEIQNENIIDENNQDDQNKNIEEQNFNVEENQNENNEEEKNEYNEGEENYNDENEEEKNQSNEEENIILNDGEEHIQNNEDVQFNQLGDEEQNENNEEEHDLNFENNNEDNNIVEDNIDMNLNKDDNMDMDMNNAYEKEHENGNEQEEHFEEYEIEENQNIQMDEEEGEGNADEALIQMGEEINNYQQELEENENMEGQEGEEMEMEMGEEYNNLEENNLEENNEKEVQN